ncbi:MAG: 4'-phosphopantetheinyl transferase family protein [Chitinophagaceae bacterium]|jgi:phosphopantetheinyl transferase|nr:4'-phosphopantetheinyl transferase superfamily protein [Sediminibacterium sp.]
MPFFYQQNINESEHLAIWSITEPLSFFEEGMTMDIHIQNEERKIQHLAVRLLFSLMMPEVNMKDIVMADNGKPYLKGVPFHFSFSHCKGYAACAVSDHFPIGIDIEIIHPRIAKVAHKFLNDAEKNMLSNLSEEDALKQLAFFWAAKEAMYKKHEQLGIDFARDFNILALTNLDRGLVNAQINHKGIISAVQLDYHYGQDYICVTCIN